MMCAIEGCGDILYRRMRREAALPQSAKTGKALCMGKQEETQNRFSFVVLSSTVAYKEKG